ncbi:hypothetical protein GDO78_000305 [Eleutherodactylus coqui]|uniref:Uncharacterized protein n=1 Tax=Eleutherodactylus coqui TaxID=57060 RepID=A0A8J6FRL2_ELECQ|nr:hypothetical protein GDO78_000305 [Eleutherodactylus coqui]
MSVFVCSGLDVFMSFNKKFTRLIGLFINLSFIKQNCKVWISTVKKAKVIAKFLMQFLRGKRQSHKNDALGQLSVPPLYLHWILALNNPPNSG